MRKLFVLFSFGLLSAWAAEQTWTGQISDNMCGADHSAMAHDSKKADPHECTLACVKGGGKYIFVSEGKVFEITNQSFGDLSAHAGHPVKLTGHLDSDGKAITVSKLGMSQ